MILDPQAADRGHGARISASVQRHCTNPPTKILKYLRCFLLPAPDDYPANYFVHIYFEFLELLVRPPLQWCNK